MDRSTRINLTFHGLGSPERSLDPGEAAVWVGVQTYRAVLDLIRGRPDVRVTFDDGNESDLSIGVPELVARGMTADFFVVAGRTGRAGFLGPAGVRDLVAAGMRVGLHGMHHRPWGEMDDTNLRVEIDDAKKAIEDVAGSPVTTAACPFGSYGRRSLACLRGAGFETVFTSDRGTARAGQWLQARNTVRAGDTPANVAAWLRPPGLAGALVRTIKTRIKQFA